jgi:hypothetical protein
MLCDGKKQKAFMLISVDFMEDSSIWVQLSYHLQWIMIGSHQTGSDVNHVTGRCLTRKYVLRMRNRKLHNIPLSGAFSREVT